LAGENKYDVNAAPPRLPVASEMRLRASENDSVICSIPEEQND
jgi:hypothetical protein